MRSSSSKTIDEVVDPNVLFHAPVPNDVTGAQALKQVWAVLVRAFPDLHVAVEDVIALGDKMVCRNTVTGTQQGEYRGLAPTGRSVTYNEIFVVRFADGRIAEIWGVVDWRAGFPVKLRRTRPRSGTAWKRLPLTMRGGPP